MTAHPMYMIYVPMPCFGSAMSDGKDIPIQPDNKLIWIRKGGPVFRYVCQNALGCNAREEDCATPYFKGTKIPEYVLDYMHHYAKTMQVGASWYRQNYGGNK